MKSTVTYLNEAKEALNLTSDYQLAKWLNVSTAALARYQSGQRTIDDYVCVRIAEALKINPLEIITAANYEREKDIGRKAFWEKFSHHRMVASIALVFVCGSMSYTGFGENFSSPLFLLAGSTVYSGSEGKPLIFNRLSIMRNGGNCVNISGDWPGSGS
jgi:hypothetical protein